MRGGPSSATDEVHRKYPLEYIWPIRRQVALEVFGTYLFGTRTGGQNVFCMKVVIRGWVISIAR